MNRKQEMIKKLAKRAKARSNKVEPSNPQKTQKPKYISKAEREKLALAQEAEQNTASSDSVQDATDEKA
ncbi:conserved hypothetical protein [Shewanella denitrificans OS217]|jgi:tRNA A37 N6-isopentenylltransferase MiaA|uniref:DUF2986 domain-containing protein n=1 Tax=Shewanella denitrificans (strain OS217 / ATCC BAA-1090 / DSM 15013) TaxID=318161 RepID=Q12LM3_SHEDO|nr:DUF2986 domain-containing protein [Shewanella denitrificans]ABE55653.1 conserved hypothetical protein [Shewanella denitrificans OS217]